MYFVFTIKFSEGPRKVEPDRCPLNRKDQNDSPTLREPLDPHDVTDFRFQELRKVSRTSPVRTGTCDSC